MPLPTGRLVRRLPALLVPLALVATGITSAPPASAAKTPVLLAAVETGIPYAHRSPRQTLDLYLPEQRGPRPSALVILIHGGAFRSGDSAQMAPMARALVRNGFAVAAVNYRRSGEARYPAGAHDVKAAVRWLRLHAREYGIDPRRFAAFGRSAGGWMATMLGVTGNRASIFDAPLVGGIRVSSTVQAVVSWNGPSDFTRLGTQLERVPRCRRGGRGVRSPQYRALSRWLRGDLARSPLAASTDLPSYIRSGWTYPKWFLAHGDADCTVPRAQSLRLRHKLVRAGARVTYVPLRGAGHREPALTGTLMNRSIGFLHRALGR